MSRKQKWMAIILCICFVAMSAFTLTTIASHADHECCGEQCEICLHISHLRNTLKQLCTAAFILAAVLSASYAVCVIVNVYKFCQRDTLISLKVQLNN